MRDAGKSDRANIAIPEEWRGDVQQLAGDAIPLGTMLAWGRGARFVAANGHRRSTRYPEPGAAGACRSRSALRMAGPPVAMDPA